MEDFTRFSTGKDRERGNILLLSFLLVTILVALASAHFATVFRSTRQSIYFSSLSELRRYAETGVNLALHELTFKTGKGDGHIGAENWSPATSDFGRDGAAATGDEGEGDGIPTPGEPNLAFASVGTPSVGMGLVAHSSDSVWPNVRRIVGVASSPEAIGAVEVYALENVNSVPGVGAVFVQPGVVLDLNGNAFRISGTDTNPDGTKGPAPETSGIATTVGNPPGSNDSSLTDQISSKSADQITGLGGEPSINETEEIDFDTVFNWFKAAPGKTLVAPGTYSGASWGSDKTNDYRVTYCTGDLHMSGASQGAGVLIVDGSLSVTGQFEFAGIVIVRGDVKITGGGSKIHIYGSLFVGKTLSTDDATLKVGGTADVIFSSKAITRASSLLGNTYDLLYWNILK